jgi:hypothetical protein
MIDWTGYIWYKYGMNMEGSCKIAELIINTVERRTEDESAAKAANFAHNPFSDHNLPFQRTWPSQIRGGHWRG